MHIVSQAGKESEAERKAADILIEVGNVRFDGGERTAHPLPQKRSYSRMKL